MTTELINMLVSAASDKERDANQLDQWANQSVSGGWSTHQVEPMRKMADRLRREAANLRIEINRKWKEARV